MFEWIFKKWDTYRLSVWIDAVKNVKRYKLWRMLKNRSINGQLFPRLPVKLLHLVAMYDNTGKTLKYLLNMYRGYVNLDVAKIDTGETALHVAVCCYNTIIVNALIAAGASLQSLDFQGQTALANLIVSHNMSILEMDTARTLCEKHRYARMLQILLLQNEQSRRLVRHHDSTVGGKSAFWYATYFKDIMALDAMSSIANPSLPTNVTTTTITSPPPPPPQQLKILKKRRSRVSRHSHQSIVVAPSSGLKKKVIRNNSI